MKLYITFFIGTVLFSMMTFSQTSTTNFELPKKYIISSDKIHLNGTISFLSWDKDISPKNHMYSFLEAKGENQKEVKSYTIGSKLNNGNDHFENYYRSPDGSNFVYFENDSFYNATDGAKIAGKDFNGDIEHDPKFHLLKKKYVDIIAKNFITDKKIVSIGRKSGKENYKEGDYEKMEVFLYTKDLKTMVEKHHKLEFPDGFWFSGYTPSLLFQNNDYFFLNYVIEGGKEGYLYQILKYDYEGNLLGSFQLDSKPTGEDEKFAMLNYGKGSFTYYNRTNLTTGRVESTFGRANINSWGQIQYSPIDSSFYLVSGLEIKKSDDGFLVTKFSKNGKKLWQTKNLISESKLVWTNSANRYLFLDASKDFVGLTFYTRKGKKHCKFYLLNPNTGELINEKDVQSHDFYKLNGLNDNFYNGLFCRHILKKEFSKNLKLNRQSILASLYYDEFRSYLNKNVEKDKGMMFISYFTPKGMITLKSIKKKRLFQLRIFILGKDN